VFIFSQRICFCEIVLVNFDGKVRNIDFKKWQQISAQKAEPLSTESVRHRASPKVGLIKGSFFYFIEKASYRFFSTE